MHHPLMWMVRGWWISIVVAFGWGCDEHQIIKPEVIKPLCDPSAPTGGRIAMQHGGSGALAPGEVLLYENGASYAFVDGQCSYWVSDSSRIWEGTRSGVLDAEAAARLGEVLHYGAWPELSGRWQSSSDVSHPPVWIFDDLESDVVCHGLCDTSNLPATVRAMREGFYAVVQELWDAGSPSASNVRAIAIAGEPSPYAPFVDWPLARPLRDFLRTGYPGQGEGTLEDDVASVRALKELRASFVRGDHGAFVWHMLPVTSDGAYYQLYLRDALPFEDSNGLVPLTLDHQAP